MFGLVSCNATLLARKHTDPELYFVRTLVRNWLWPIIAFFGVTGNILAIVVLTKRRMIMSSTNNYLVALALVDIAYLTLTLILNTLQNPCFVNQSSAVILLTICRPIADFASNSSVWLTVTFTVERWVAITYPLQSRTWCTVHRARKLILTVLCASLICTLPSAFEMKLVRTVETKKISNRLVSTNRIVARRTRLGESVLYQLIYFNFVTYVLKVLTRTTCVKTDEIILPEALCSCFVERGDEDFVAILRFAIIYIPLILLVIFNTILISYVRHSKQNKEGIELRRHNRVNQNEQRKTTIMLIAVVLVFTVCQIPQAISLTIQSYFPQLDPTPRFLIYNNFANCLVAVNASINFVLYCCFSDRFRSVFRSHFTFLSKYCVQYVHPQWKSQTTKHSTSVDTISITNALNTRVSNLSVDFNSKYSTQLNQKSDGNPHSISIKPKPTTNFVRQSSATNYQYPLHRDSNRLSSQSKLRPKSYSYRSLNDQKKSPEQIWIRRHQSQSSIEQFLRRGNEILDVTV